MTSKRRASNFKPEEKEVLFPLIKEFADIIENKKTDKVTNREKDIAWIDIANIYNASKIDMVRDSRQLRTFYDNWRRRMRKVFLEEKAAAWQANGGPPPISILDNTDLDLLEILRDKIISSDSQNDSNSDASEACESANGSVSLNTTPAVSKKRGRPSSYVASSPKRKTLVPIAPKPVSYTVPIAIKPFPTNIYVSEMKLEKSQPPNPNLSRRKDMIANRHTRYNDSIGNIEKQLVVELKEEEEAGTKWSSAGEGDSKMFHRNKCRDSETWNEEDPNLTFFRSLLPDMNMLDTKQQRKFKMKVMQILNSFLDSREEPESE